MKHTPGPWFRLSGGIITKSVLADHSNEKNFVTVLHEHTSDANAHLVASAPELLEALKYVIDIADNVKGAEMKCYKQAFSNARKAIAKAEGKAAKAS